MVQPAFSNRHNNQPALPPSQPPALPSSHFPSLSTWGEVCQWLQCGQLYSPPAKLHPRVRFLFLKLHVFCFRTEICFGCEVRCSSVTDYLFLERVRCLDLVNFSPLCSGSHRDDRFTANDLWTKPGRALRIG